MGTCGLTGLVFLAGNVLITGISDSQQVSRWKERLCPHLNRCLEHLAALIPFYLNRVDCQEILA